MGTTPLGMVYPDPSALPSRKTWIEDPIKSVDTAVQSALAALSKRTKSGTSSGTIAIGQGFVDVTVTFTTPFAATPRVTATPQATFHYQTNLQSRSATGFVVRILRPVSAPTTAAAAVSFDWIATDLGDA